MILRMMLRAGLLLCLLAGGARAATIYGPQHTVDPASNDSTNLIPTTNWVQQLLTLKALPLTGGTLSGNLTVGGTLGVTGATTLTGAASAPGGLSVVSGTAAPSGGFTANTITASSSSNTFTLKNAPSGTVLLTAGGSNGDIEPKVTVKLPLLSWTGSGDTAPLLQNTATTGFTGTTTSSTAGFGLWLQQYDNSSCQASGAGGACYGIFEHLVLNGSSVVGNRSAGQAVLDVSAITGNGTGKQYGGWNSKCNLFVSDASGGSSCFGANQVAHIGPGVTASQGVGNESDTWISAGASVIDRIVHQAVDTIGTAADPTYGQPGTRDDLGYSPNNQYSPCYFSGATGSISGTTLTITVAPSVGSIGAACVLSGSGVATPTNIVSLGTGTGGTGTYVVNVSQTSSSGTINGIAGLQTAIKIGRRGGFFPVSPIGTIIGGTGNSPGNYDTAFQVANGIDWSLGTATGQWLNLGGVFTVSGAGVLSAASYKAGATAGVTCAGTPSASFAATGGIVTHC